MKKIFIVTLLLLGASILSANAQDRFKDGYIVTLENDTLHGQIEYKPEYSNYKICHFRSNKIDKTYSPDQILAYGSGVEKCFSSTVLKDKFVEVLIEGKMSLYGYKNIFYVRKQGGDIHKLEKIKHVVEVGDGEGIMVDNRWKGILSYLASDCLSNPNKILRNKKFSEMSITNFVIRYNKCSSVDYIDYKKDLPWFRINVGALAGVSISYYDMPVETVSLTGCKDRYSTLSPTIGAAFEMCNPRLSDRLSLNTELLYYKINISSPVVKDGIWHLVIKSTEMDYSVFSIPLSLKYTLFKRKFSPFIQAGLVYSYVNDGEILFSTKRKDGGEITLHKEIPYKLRSYQTGYWGGLGISKSYNKFKICANVRYYMKPIDFNINNNILEFSVIIYSN